MSPDNQIDKQNVFYLNANSYKKNLEGLPPLKIDTNMQTHWVDELKDRCIAGDILKPLTFFC